MTKKKDTNSVPASLTPEERITLRQQLGVFMRETREQHIPYFTQMALSRELGFSYSVVTSWENGGRTILEGQVQKWCEKLGVAFDLSKAPLATFAAVIQDNETSRPNSGSRMQGELNARLKLIREQKNLSIREMGELLGMSTTHYFRVENNQGNLTLEQLRSAAKRLDVSYDYLLDGKGEGESYHDLKAEIKRLQRENELLESFRQQVELQKQ